MIHGLTDLQLAAIGIGVATLLLLLAALYRKRQAIRRRWAAVKASISGASKKTGGFLTSRRFKSFLFSIIGFGAVVAVFWYSWRAAGPINTIIYFLLFGVSLTFLPVLIYLKFVPSALGIKAGVGKLHFVMAQVASGVGWLVQVNERIEYCPGDEEGFYYEGDWYRDVDDAVRNSTVLGWMPFKMAYFKDDDSLKEFRVDPANEVRSGIPTTADGGYTVERGDGLIEKRPDASVSGMDDTWLVDIKRLFSEGIEQFGDIDLVDTTEEITMRKEAKSKNISGWKPIIGASVGLLIGILTGVLMMGPPT